MNMPRKCAHQWIAGAYQRKNFEAGQEICPPIIKKGSARKLTRFDDLGEYRVVSLLCALCFVTKEVPEVTYHQPHEHHGRKCYEVSDSVYGVSIGGPMEWHRDAPEYIDGI